jgi:alpha-amylase
MFGRVAVAHPVRYFMLVLNSALRAYFLRRIPFFEAGLPARSVFQQSLVLFEVSLLFVCLSEVRTSASSCTISPSQPISGRAVTVTYDPAGGPLAAATTVQIYRSFNNYSQIAAPDQVMTYNSALHKYTFTYTVPEPAFVLNYDFHDTNTPAIWDNRNNQNWNFSVLPGPATNPLPPPPPLSAKASRANVMMEGFYWNVPAGGTWYVTMAGKAATLRNMLGGQGIDRIWFPPPSKSQTGGFSMGYDPYDYYDLGNFNQNGTTPTRFGTQVQLKNVIASYKAQGIACMGDVVLNHRSGGFSESNPNLGGASTYTDYSHVLSGKCTWRYNQFHPSTFELSDEGGFGGFADVCNVTGNTAGTAYYDLIQWGQWLTNANNAGFDGGWRFDYIKGYRPSFAADFRANTGNAFGIVESWGDISNIDEYVTYSAGASAFDFPGYYTMRDICNDTIGTQNIADLVNPTMVYAAKNPARAVTFCANHDIDEITTNKMLAYAFMLTYQGYPCIFWKDYFDSGLATLGGQTGNGINGLVWARGVLGGGQPTIQLLKTNDSDLLAYGTLNGSVDAPGYLTAINHNPSGQRSAAVTTANNYLKGKNLRCYAWYSYINGANTQPADTFCDATGAVTLLAPASGYAVYGPAQITTLEIPPGGYVPGSTSLKLVLHKTIPGKTYNLFTATTLAGNPAWNLALTFSGGSGEATTNQISITGLTSLFIRAQAQ